MRRTIPFLIAAVVCLISASAQTRLTDCGKPSGRILIADSSDVPAARMMQKFIRRISNAEIPVIHAHAKPRKGDILIGRSSDSRITEDGFRALSRDGRLTIESTDSPGALYGVITILERYLGCNYWSEHDFSAPRQSTVILPDFDFIDNPAFRYRQSQNYALRTDSDYRKWMRLEEPSDEFAAGLWVHTFDRLLPSAIYGETHPEYYAWFNGARHPGKASQWCLSNPEVFEIVATRIDSIFKANPGRNMISVSQNDGNYTFCQCDACAAIDSVEGAQSGSIIRFLNRLADRFPDKQFSTLAYLYTMHPPKLTRPRPNVNIMLCDIDCYREVPLQGNPSGRDFLKALNGWAKISDNIFLWDYGINFDGTSTPFPNFHIIAPNIRTFRDNNVKMHFSQIAGYRGGDMSELRTWLISKLMWNPDADVDSLKRVFLNGFYGPAAPYIDKYLTLMEGALLGSRIPLWIYDSPVTHKDGMLNPVLLSTYNHLFDSAENAVDADSAFLDRVRRSRLPLQYAELEILRTDPARDPAHVEELLDTFQTRSARYGLTSVNERNNSPLDYCRLYRSRYLNPDTTNLARGAKITFSKPVPAPYDKIAPAALTDGLYGGATYKDAWVGWEGTDVAITIDFGTTTEFQSVSVDFLSQLGAWILQPLSVTFLSSTDGRDWKQLGRRDYPDDRSPQVRFVDATLELSSPCQARFVRIDIEATKQCPHWHYGVGNPCWVFLDEISIR